MMLLICENCGVFVHQNWEFCRRCGGELPGAQDNEPRLVPRIPIERLPLPRTALEVPGAVAHSLRRLWAPVEARLSAQLEHWSQNEIDVPLPEPEAASMSEEEIRAGLEEQDPTRGATANGRAAAPATRRSSPGGS